MARIKQVLNERRLAYLGAAKLLAKTETPAIPDVAQSSVTDTASETSSVPSEGTAISENSA